MPGISYVSVTILIYSAIVIVVMASQLFVSRDYDRERTATLFRLMMTTVMIDLADACTYLSDGDPSYAGYIMVRASNFILFAGNYLSLCFFADYLFYSVKAREEKVCLTLRKASWIVSGIGLIVLVLSRFFGFYYTFDGSNRYERGASYWALLLFAEMVLVFVLIFVILTWKRLKNWERAAYLSVVIFPVIGVVLQSWIRGISLSTIAGNITVIIIFLVHQMEYIYGNRAYRAYHDLKTLERAEAADGIAERLIEIRAGVMKRKDGWPEDRAARRFATELLEEDAKEDDGPGALTEEIVRALIRKAGECGSGEIRTADLEDRRTAAEAAADSYFKGIRPAMEEAADKGQDHKDKRKRLGIKGLERRGTEEEEAHDFVMRMIFGGDDSE